MKKLSRKLQRLLPRRIRDFPDHGEGPGRYNLLRRNLVFIMCAMALIPLVLMTAINYHQYQSALREEIFTPIRRLINSTKHNLDLFLAEHESTLRLLIRTHTLEELSNQRRLGFLFQNLQQEFPEFVDLGLIDSSGKQRTYTGPYGLGGRNYSDQSWFREVQLRGVHISDVFLGYRKFPHFVIAIKNNTPEGDFYMLRATIDMEKFTNLITTISPRPGTDMFLINQEGILQTPSRYYGSVLEKFPLAVPPRTLEPAIQETTNPQGNPILLGYASLRMSSFTLIVIKKPAEIMGSWLALRGELLLIFIVSAVVIVLVALRTSKLLTARIQQADQKREAYYAEMEHTAKLASLGRLAAGVAHEINNPLAIINEKAGLMKDLVTFSKKYQDREKFLTLIDSILRSVERGRDITHRLLGFAKRMDGRMETIHLNELLKEVLGFLEKEAFHRNIAVHMDFAPDLPTIDNDRGQLQQVFLNVINNAFEAVDDGGNITLATRQKDSEMVEVSVADDGRGMSPEQLKHIFEPFYTSGKEQGTGLGLSIAYGIVSKCGGDIKVHSLESEGTTFTVELPRWCKLG
ncbi:MAG: ATP-binding protein [Syntrophobacteria bacterium]